MDDEENENEIIVEEIRIIIQNMFTENDNGQILTNQGKVVGDRVELAIHRVCRKFDIEV